MKAPIKVTDTPSRVSQHLEETVRAERGWLIASLVRHLGPGQVALAEDVAQDAIVRALSTWPYKGIPSQPRAWLRRVAGNIAIDRLRRDMRLTELDDSLYASGDPDAVITPRLNDPELDLFVLCCDPRLAPGEQIALALTLGCGFKASRLARLFLVSENTMQQRLARAKRKLRHHSGQVARFPTRFALVNRLPHVLRILYLMYTMGYFPPQGDRVYDADICNEALRLCLLLRAHSGALAGACDAVCALIYLQTSRFPARISEAGTLITVKDQDRHLWDRRAIQAGLAHLQAAQQSQHLTRYHLEAAIAAQHSLAPNWATTDWETICRLYRILADIAPGISVRTNWAVAELMRGDGDAAARLLEDIAETPQASTQPGYLLARAHISNMENAQACSVTLTRLQTALELSQSAPVRAHIADTIDKLKRGDTLL